MNHQLFLGFEAQPPPQDVWNGVPAESRRQAVQTWAEVMLRTRRQAPATAVGVQVVAISADQLVATPPQPTGR